MCLDKLGGIWGDLVRTDDNWRHWDFIKLLEALRQWTERNPVKVHDKPNNKADRQSNSSRMNAFQAPQREVKQRWCVYCNEVNHTPVNCFKVFKSVDRKRYLSERRLYFNCTGAEHRALECQNRSSCFKCKRRHHASICHASGKNAPPTAPTNDRLLNTATNAISLLSIQLLSLT